MTWSIYVSNPSPYERSDYVEVNLQKLEVPSELNEKNLILFRVKSDQDREEIPFQIDSVLGSDSSVRILTFLSTQTPGSAEDYSQSTATFELEQGTPTDFSTDRSREYLRIDHYYEQPDPNKGDANDGYNKDWDPNRKVYGVKIHNGQLQFFVSLVPHPWAYTAIDYTGSVTNIEFKGALDDMLSPIGNKPEKRWGQLYQLIFFPAPWTLDWFKIVSLKDKKYDLIWSHCGNIASTITMRSSEPISLQYTCSPYFKEPAEVTLNCYLYRVIHAYPDKPFYLEDIFVLTEEGLSIRFRPYFESEVCYSPHIVKNNIARFEDIPDYFALWKSYAGVSRGYGFAADGHVRRLEIGFTESEPNMIRWRLEDTHHNRCVNYFMYHGVDWQDFDAYHEVGHSAWYEQIFKPLETIPYEIFSTAKRYMPL